LHEGQVKVREKIKYELNMFKSISILILTINFLKIGLTYIFTNKQINIY